MRVLARSPALRVTAAVAFSTALDAKAESSNRNEVRAALERDGWHVVWGKNFTEADWARGAKAIAQSVATENPGPFRAWFSGVMDENLAKIQRNVPGLTKRMLKGMIVQSLRAKKIIVYRGLKIHAGFATYDRWQRVVYHEPATVETWWYVGPIKTKGFKTIMVKKERRINLPNWHQLYLRIKLNRRGRRPRAAPPRCGGRQGRTVVA